MAHSRSYLRSQGKSESEMKTGKIKILTIAFCCLTSRKRLRTKVTQDFHLTYSKNGGNLGSGSKIKSEKFQYFSIKSYVVDVY